MVIDADRTLSQQFASLVESMFMGVNLTRVASDASDSRTVPVIHVKDLDDGRILPPQELDTVSIGASKLGRQELQAGDLLVSARGTLLKCAVLREPHIGCIASANFIVIRPGAKSPIEPDLLCAFLRQVETKTLLLSRVSGTAQPVLTIKDLEALVIVVPPPEKQMELSRLINLADELYRTTRESAELRRDEALDVLAHYMREANAEI